MIVDVVNIRHFGAVPDGRDCGEAIQRALDFIAEAGDREIFFEDGVYFFGDEKRT